MKRILTIVILLLLVPGCGSAPKKVSVAAQVTPEIPDAKPIVAVDDPNDPEGWTEELERTQSRHNQYINTLIDRRNALREKIIAAEGNPTELGRLYYGMEGVLSSIIEHVDKRDLEISAIRKQKMASAISHQPVSEAFLNEQAIEQKEFKARLELQADERRVEESKASPVAIRAWKEMLSKTEKDLRELESAPPIAPPARATAKTIQKIEADRAKAIENLRNQAQSLRKTIKDAQ